jgi:lipoprotein-anchoring transpeptidase ErfK/SrfK
MAKQGLEMRTALPTLLRPQALRTLRAGAALLVLSVVLLTHIQPLSAAGRDRGEIADDHTAPGLPDVPAGPSLVNAPALPEHAYAAALPHPTQKPRLPFSTPQVGPVIKRAFANDIERRTTAFLPATLDHLTPVEMPEGEERWIRVDLSEQQVVAYEGKTPIRGFVISSGLPRTPTVTGEFRIRTKVKVQTMSGGSGSDYYNLPNVKWVQYFYQAYAFHGTYWHNDFGRPKSHGCLNMTNADAKWLFDWAGPKWDGKTVWFNSTEDNPGTLVIVTE